MMSEKDNWNTGRSVKYKNTLHLVFVTKYRRNVFTDFLLSELEPIFKETCEQMQGELIEFNGEGNHVHLVISAHPKYALSNVIGKLKGKSSYLLRKNHFDKIKHALWGKHFWSPSYCVVSTGGVSLEVVRKYVEDQNRPD